MLLPATGQRTRFLVSGLYCGVPQVRGISFRRFWEGHGFSRTAKGQQRCGLQPAEVTWSIGSCLSCTYPTYLWETNLAGCRKTGPRCLFLGGAAIYRCGNCFAIEYCF
jgi:hypothetical protein